MKHSLTSLRGRLVLGAFLVGIAFAIIFGAGATWRLHHLEERAVTTALTSRLDLARDEVASNGMLVHDQSSPKTDLVQIIGVDGTVRSASAGLAQVGALVDVRAVRQRPAGLRATRSFGKPDVDLATLSVPIALPRNGSQRAGTGALVVAVDAEGFNSATADLLKLLGVGLISVVGAIVLLSWWLTGLTLRSVAQLTEEAETVGARDLMKGLPLPAGDAELARLVRALNRMLSRLHESHDKELAFASDAGHRLRTPIATLRAEAELALREVDPAEQVLALRRIVLDADQLTAIVNRMLARSRSHGAVDAPVRIAVRDASAGWVRHGEVVDVAVTVDVKPSVDSSVTCPGLIDVVEPLVDNAVQHSRPGGAVQIVLSSRESTDGTVMTIDVCDTGTGVEPDLAPVIFDAWVSSRDASIAGGLGLWLSREKARDLGGDVTLHGFVAGVTTFRAILPAGPNPEGDGNQAAVGETGMNTSGRSSSRHGRSHR